MTEQYLSDLFKLGPLVGVMALALWTLWKRYDKRMNDTNEEIKKLRDRFEQYLSNDRVDLLKVVDENSTIIKTINSTLNRSNNLSECLRNEIKDFKLKYKTT